MTHTTTKAREPSGSFAVALAAASGRDAPHLGTSFGRSGIAVIGEIKRRLPSDGHLIDDSFDVARQVSAYETGGAAAVSVLTCDRFDGSPDDLRTATRSTSLPVLRKDFLRTEADVEASVDMGASAVLLIARDIPDDGHLTGLAAVATDTGLDVLFEAHDEAEIVRCVDAGARIVGVNQRDLRTMRVDDKRAARLARHLPDDVLRVAMSGIASTTQVAEMAACGYDAVLVGAALMRSTCPAHLIRQMRAETHARRAAQ